MPYNAWVQICPLDQPISNSAFNDCSVTVIYSGVIITDVLLLRDGPSAPPPSPSSFCADVIVFFRDYSGLFLLWCFAFFLFFSFGFLNARLPRWPDFRGGSHGVSWPSGDREAPCERRSRIPPPPLPRTNHGAACLTWLNTYMYLQPASTLHSNLSVIYPLLPDVHMSVSEWVSEWVRMCAACSCVQCVCENVCTCVFSYPCWYKLVTALAWTSLGVSAFFFFYLNVVFFYFSLEVKTQESSLATH